MFEFKKFFTRKFLPKYLLEKISRLQGFISGTFVSRSFSIVKVTRKSFHRNIYWRSLRTLKSFLRIRRRSFRRRNISAEKFQKIVKVLCAEKWKDSSEKKFFAFRSFRRRSISSRKVFAWRSWGNISSRKVFAKIRWRNISNSKV